MAALAIADPQLGRVISDVGSLSRLAYPDPFMALVWAITGQQISSKAQAAIMERMIGKFGQLLPVKITAESLEALRACGLSERKANYIKNLAREFASGNISAEDLKSLDDESIIKRLSQLPGIGIWTVEMLLIFAFQRPNVLSFGDLAIKRGMAILYGHEKVTREIFAAHYMTYSPWATTASLYLWEVASGRWQKSQ